MTGPVLDCHGRRTRVGSRIRLVATADPYTRLTPGDLGTVTKVGHDPWSAILGVQWDSGSTLGLCADEDMWAIIPELCTCNTTTIFHERGCPVAAPTVVDTADPAPVRSQPSQDDPTVMADTVQQPSGPELALAARLWDEAMCEALAKRGIVATPHDGSGALVLPRQSVEQLIVMLPVKPSESAVGARQPSG